MKPIFKDRYHAGKELARQLLWLKDEHVIVLAIPRGGVQVAAPIAEQLNAFINLIIPRKIGVPQNPEMAVGAVTPDGVVLWNRQLLKVLEIDPADLAPVVERELQEIKRRMEVYGQKDPGELLKDRTVILVDDGIATGLTVEAALESIKLRQVRKVILAVPVGPKDVIEHLRQKAEVICLATPDPFYAVGMFYEKFQQIRDEQVIKMLQHNRVPIE